MLTLHNQPYVIAGLNNSAVFNTVYSFDLVAGVWTECAPMPKPLFNHRAVALDRDNALVCEGMNETLATQFACYLYNATQDAWTVSMSMNTTRKELGMTVYRGAYNVSYLLLMLTTPQTRRALLLIKIVSRANLRYGTR